MAVTTRVLSALNATLDTDGNPVGRLVRSAVPGCHRTRLPEVSPPARVAPSGANAMLWSEALVSSQ